MASIAYCLILSEGHYLLIHKYKALSTNNCFYYTILVCILAIIPVLILGPARAKLIRPRIINPKHENKLYYKMLFAFWIMLVAPTIIVQIYVTTDQELPQELQNLIFPQEVQSIKEINNYPHANTFKLTRYFLDKSNYGTYETNNLPVKTHEREYNVYIISALCADSLDTAKENRQTWVGFRYSMRADLDLSKDSISKAYLNECQKQFQATALTPIIYVQPIDQNNENLGYSEYITALKNNRNYNGGKAMIFRPCGDTHAAIYLLCNYLYIILLFTYVSFPLMPVLFGKLNEKELDAFLLRKRHA